MERKKDKGSQRSRHEWRSLLAKLEGGDPGGKAFCRRQGIGAASFYRWRSRLGNGSGGDGDGHGDGCAGVGSDAAPAFIDLGTLDSASSSRLRIELKLDLGDGLTLHLVRN